MKERDARYRELAQAAFEAKAERRQAMARLPIEEKVRILVELQRIAAEIRKATGRPAREPWDLRRPG